MKKDLLIDSSGLVLNLLEKILNANIEIKGIENIPKDHPTMFVANHFTRMEAMIVPYAMYDLTGKKVGVIADDSLFKTYFGKFLSQIGAMKKSNPCRNSIITGDLISGKKRLAYISRRKNGQSKRYRKRGESLLCKNKWCLPKSAYRKCFFCFNLSTVKRRLFS